MGVSLTVQCDHCDITSELAEAKGWLLLGVEKEAISRIGEERLLEIRDDPETFVSDSDPLILCADCKHKTFPKVFPKPNTSP